MHRHLRRYMNWIPVDYVDAMAPTTGFAGSEDELVAVLRAFEAVGTDEIQLIPTSSDIDQAAAGRGDREGDSMSERNVLGGPLEPCGSDPLTGFYRDGCC